MVLVFTQKFQLLLGRSLKLFKIDKILGQHTEKLLVSFCIEKCHNDQVVFPFVL